MSEFLKNKKILVVAAHPDDEILGMGATMNKLQQFCEIRVIILGEGLTSRSEDRIVEDWSTELKIHRKNIEDAKNEIGYKELQTYQLPDNRFDTVALLDLIKIVENEKSVFNPDIVFTHHAGDLNIDHRKTFEAVMTAFRPLENETCKLILSFEVPSSTEWAFPVTENYFKPNFFIGIENEHLRAKIKAMESYTFEKRNFPHPRSAEALETIAKRWGSVTGTKLAEAFILVRGIL